MPSTNTAKHFSGLSIYFDETNHTYTDERGDDYVSVTQLIGRAFPKFNATKTAEAKAKREGGRAEDYIREWDEAGKIASRNGTRAHENCEHQIRGEYDRMHQPESDEERARFRACWNRVCDLQEMGYDRLTPELIVFSPRFHVAGSVDLLAQRTGNAVDIYDWKFIKKLERENRWGQTGVEPATANLPDTNFWHYALQLAVYEQILRLEGYIASTAAVSRTLNVYLPGAVDFEAVQLPDLRYEALMLLTYNATTDGLDGCPF